MSDDDKARKLTEMKDAFLGAMNDPDIRREMVKILETPDLLRRAAARIVQDESLYSPEAISLLVDTLQSSGVDLNHFPGNNLKYGIPATREEFDQTYENARQHGMDAKPMLTILSQANLDEDALRSLAAQKIMSAKQLVPVARELQSRGIDPTSYTQVISAQALGPADIDLTKLDPRLTEAERIMVERATRISKLVTEEGMLFSTPDDAPETSSWKERVNSQAGQVAAEAIEKARGK